MDWSLVLASQSIDTAIERRPDDGAWVLIVSVEDLTRASDSIRSYEKENTSAWRQEIKGTGLLFDWRSLFWWAMIVAITVSAWFLRPHMQDVGQMDRGLFFHGQWWRAFTAVTLHADAAHLALNASIGFVLLGLAMGSYGAGTAMLSAFVSGSIANIIEAFLRPTQYFSLGASGMVMAALGLLAAHSLLEQGRSVRERAGRGVLAACLLFILIGLDLKSDILAHLLGFVVGTSSGLLLGIRARPFAGKGLPDLAAAAICAVVVAATWALAIGS
jgi:rhomboid protease GluP